MCPELHAEGTRWNIIHNLTCDKGVKPQRVHSLVRGQVRPKQSNPAKQNSESKLKQKRKKKEKKKLIVWVILIDSGLSSLSNVQNQSGNIVKLCITFSFPPWSCVYSGNRSVDI